MKRYKLLYIALPTLATLAVALSLGCIYLRRALLAMLGAAGNVSTLMTEPWGALAERGEALLREAGYANSGVGLLLGRGGFGVLALLVLLAAALSLAALLLYASRRAKRSRREVESLTDFAVTGTNPGPLTDEQHEELRRALEQRFSRHDSLISALELERVRYVRFLHDICHQIKTPLTTLAVLLERLKTAPSSELIADCEKQIERASDLTDTLLRGGQFESGAIKLNWSRSSPYLLLEDIAFELSALSDERGLTVSVEGNSHELADFDERWLREALENILKNCIEHCREGGNILCAAAVDDTACTVTIANEGERVREDGDIFALYESGGEGFGIGLNLAQHIVRAHFGSLTAENTPTGVLFTVTLPKLSQKIMRDVR